MKKKDLLANVPPKEPNKKEVVANIFKVGKMPVLELTWIDTVSMEPHLIRHFVWEGHYLTYRGERANEEAAWTREQYETALCGQPYRYGTTSDNETGPVIQEFLKKIGAQTSWMSSYERWINLERQNKADSRKQKRITQRVSEITPPLPPGFIQWAKKQSARYVYLLQNYKNRTIDRRFELDRRDGETIITEFVRGLSYTPGQAWDEYYYGERYGRYGKAQTFWDKKCWNAICDRTGLLYPGTLHEITWESEIAYRAIKEEAASGTEMNYGANFRRYQVDRRAEKIVKSGYRELITLWRRGAISLFDVKPKEGINEMLDITKGRYRLLRKMNAGQAVILAAQEGTRERPYYSDKELMMLHKVPGEKRRREIEMTARSKRLPLAHLIKLLKAEDPSEISKYRDYLDMARALGENIHDEIVYRNKRWKEYHDRHIAELEKIKDDKRKKEVDYKYRRIRKEAAVNRKRFGWMTKGFVMVVPELASDIVTEGRLQHHCVGSGDRYIKAMNEGESYIVFLRKEEEKETPYYTIEAKEDGTILQAYAAYDRKPDWDTVKKVLDKWKREVRKRLKEENNERVSMG